MPHNPTLARPAVVPAFLMAALLAACSTPMPPAASLAPVADNTSAAAAPASTAAAAATQTPESRVATAPSAPLDVPAHLDPNSPLNAARSVYFGFDEYVVAPTQVTVIERQGRYLVDQSALMVRVEGHTDERGGSEYNLALGQKRAEAVRQALRIQGVPLARIEAVSFGEERPRAQGDDESSWAQNRRADVAYVPR